MQGRGVQLSYKSLPHHTTRANLPVTVNSVDELAALYAQQFQRSASFTISTADSSSLLNILAKASCFPQDIRQAAARVRDQVIKSIESSFISLGL